MSADLWVDCPCCEAKDMVRVDRVYDFELTVDGNIISDIKAYCTNCKKEWRIKRGK